MFEVVTVVLGWFLVLLLVDEKTQENIQGESAIGSGETC